MAAPSTVPSSPSARLSQISGHLPSTPSVSTSAPPTPDTPSPTPHQSNLTTPSAILIFAWGGATVLQLSRYVAKYSALYPSARIIPLGSPFSDFLPWPIRAQRQKEEGFDKILEACPPSEKDKNGVLVHIFSNGGAYRFCIMATRYLLTTHMPLPIRAMVLDSAPSPASARSKAETVTTGMALTGPIRFISLILLLLALSLERMWTFVTWQNEPVSWARKVLNDPGIVKRDSARVYIYSLEDKVVDWRGVEAHAEEARRQGYTVETERFRGSQHVSHAKVHPERYWTVISRTWDIASAAGGADRFRYGKIEKAKEE